MNRIAFTLLCYLIAAKAMAQGTINFNVRIPADEIDARVYCGDELLSGDVYSAQLYAGPATNSFESSLRAVGPVVHFRTGTGAGYPLTPNPSVIVIPGVPGGQKATLQLRVWDNIGGTVTSWEAATWRGQSEQFESSYLGDDTANPPTIPANLVGLTSFSICIPEASSLALGTLAALAMIGQSMRLKCSR